MDYYHLWHNLKDTSKAVEFCGHVERYMTYLRERGLIEGYCLSRRKLGFGPDELGEFHIVIETRDMAQLEQVFQRVAAWDDEVDQYHRPVYSAVKDVRAGLYRDFPDAVRQGGPSE